VITFQYLFFQNIVFFYNPLSIAETKYILYHIMESSLNNTQT
jgi:hypothetical protein